MNIKPKNWYDEDYGSYINEAKRRLGFINKKKYKRLKIKKRRAYRKFKRSICIKVKY